MEDGLFSFHWQLWKHGLLTDKKKVGFFLEHPTVTRWIVVVKPLRRHFQRLFAFSLKYEPIEPRDVTAEILVVTVLLNERGIYQSELTNYVFDRSSAYEYAFDVEVPEDIYWYSYFLNINIQIRLSRGGNAAAHVVRNGAEVPFLWGGEPGDLLDLITKLQQCRDTGLYSTITVNGHRGHHYILRERWTHFFQLEGVEDDIVSVTINISNRIVDEILNYVYTGRVRSILIPWTNAIYITELFQVIFRYQIFHFYKVLTPRTSRLALSSRNHVYHFRVTILLSYVENTFITPHSVTIPINVHFEFLYPIEPAVAAPGAPAVAAPGAPAVAAPGAPAVAVPGAPAVAVLRQPAPAFFELSVHVKHRGQCGVWLSYTLRSHARIPFQVQLALKTTLDGIDRFVDYEDFDIPASGTVESREILFLGSCHMLRVDPSATPAIHPDLNFNIKFFDGSIIYRYSALDEAEIAEGLSVQILCDHMRRVLEQEYLSDLGVSTTDTGNGPEARRHRIHKGIFNARVPGWRNVTTPPVPADAPLPNEINLPVNDESWNRIASYMYTGKLLPVPHFLRDEMWNFAFISQFESLQNLIASHWDELN